MIRLAGTLLMALTLLGAAGLAADEPADQPEPPIRLKKKVRPEAEPEKPEPKPKEDTPEPTDRGEDAKETLARVSQNMDKSEKRLAQRDAGDGTRQIQRDILKDLDSLIDQKRQQQQQQGGGGGGSSSSSSSSSAGNSGSRSGSKSSSRNGKGSQSSDSKGPQQGSSEPKSGNGNGNKAGMGNSQEGKDLNRLADLYKDVWGHLPEKMRLEMDSYAKEKFMARYRELLEQYYATVAEKGRRQGEAP